MRAQRQTPTGTILRLVPHQNDDTQQLLRALETEAEFGEITDVLVCYRNKDGAELFIGSGRYRRNFAYAVNAAARLQHLLLRMQEADD